MNLVLPAATLAHRELIRFGRQRSRVLGALLTPVVFWLLIGAGFGASFTSSQVQSDRAYLEYFFPGTLALVILFTAVFSSISLIEDRHKGFLQAVLASPAARPGIALGKIAGNTILATAQGMLLLLLAPLAGISFGDISWPLAVASAATLAFALASLGFAMAWLIDSVQGFHSVMNLVLIPLWILSGALFPPDSAARWLDYVMRINPLTYGLAALRRSLYTPDALAGAALPDPGVSLAIMLLFGAACFLLAAWLVARPRST